MKKITCQYKTLSGSIYPLEVFAGYCVFSDIVYDPDYIRGLCKGGCSNYGVGGGCPPRAPLLENILGDKQSLLLICAKFYCEHKPPKVREAKNRAIHWKFQDAILARFMNDLGWRLTQPLEGFFLGTGYCMGCPGKKCNYKLGNNFCRNSKRRTFSMESTGINVVATVKNLFDEDFHWYTKSTPDIPYMMKCILFISDRQPKQVEEYLYKVLGDHCP